MKTNADGSLHLGTGYWFLNAHEVLLVGTKGDIPAPAPGTQFPSVIFAPVGRHSEKPAVFRKMIETMFPNLPKVEMFARGNAPPGWRFWGNEATNDVAGAAAWLDPPDGFAIIGDVSQADRGIARALLANVEPQGSA